MLIFHSSFSFWNLQKFNQSPFVFSVILELGVLEFSNIPGIFNLNAKLIFVLRNTLALGSADTEAGDVMSSCVFAHKYLLMCKAGRWGFPLTSTRM